MAEDEGGFSVLQPVRAGGCVSISFLEKKATIEAGVEPPSGRDRPQNLDVDRFLKP